MYYTEAKVSMNKFYLPNRNRNTNKTNKLIETVLPCE